MRVAISQQLQQQQGSQGNYLGAVDRREKGRWRHADDSLPVAAQEAGRSFDKCQLEVPASVDGLLGRQGQRGRRRRFGVEEQ